MPLIQVRVIKDVFSKEQKRQIISKLTDAMVSIEGENMRGVTWCVVEEVESGDWGIGGNALTTSDVHALPGARRPDLPQRRRRRKSWQHAQGGELRRLALGLDQLAVDQALRDLDGVERRALCADCRRRTTAPGRCRPSGPRGCG